MHTEDWRITISVVFAAAGLSLILRVPWIIDHFVLGRVPALVEKRQLTLVHHFLIILTGLGMLLGAVLVWCSK